MIFFKRALRRVSLIVRKNLMDSNSTGEYVSFVHIHLDRYIVFVTDIDLNKGILTVQHGDFNTSSQELSINQLKSSQFKIIYTNTWDTFGYRSLYSYYFLHRRPILCFKQAIRNIRNYIVRKLSLKRTDLYKVVNCLVNRPSSTNTSKKYTDVRDLMELMNPTVKWLYDPSNGVNTHREYTDTVAYYELLLEALVESGELEHNAMFYEIKPKLFLTYQRMQTEEKRHKQILWVSVCSAFATALATYASFRH